MLGGDDRRDLAHDQLGHGLQVALALEHARDPGEVRLQPVLLRVDPGGLAEVLDHLVDVVRELGDLALRLDLDRPRQVALGHRGRHLGDRAHLGREVAGELVDVLGEVAPRAGHALDAGLTAELALGADLARDAGDLVGERRELVDHDVDRLLELEDLALGVDRDLLAEVAVGDRGRDLGDVADLARQVRRHEVHVVGQVAPRARRRPATSAWPPSLPSVPTSRATRVTSSANEESCSTIVLIVSASAATSPFASTVIFLRQVAVGHRRRHLGDAAHLVGEVRGHAVDVLGQALPGAATRRPPRPGRRACPRCRPRGRRASPPPRTRGAGRPSC